MSLVSGNLTVASTYTLTKTDPLEGTVTTGSRSSSFSLGTGFSVSTWDQVFAQRFVVFAKVVVTGDTAMSSTSITNVSSTTNLAVGQRITGVGIPAGARITVINSSTAITISSAATANGAGVTLTCFNAPIGLAAVVASGGTLAANTYYYVITATGTQGNSETETYISNEVSATTSGGNLTINLTWTALTGATGYKIYRGTSSTNEDKLVGTITSGSTVAFSDTGFAGDADTPPVSQPDPYVEFTVQTFDNLVSESVTLTAFLTLQIKVSGDDGATCTLSSGASDGLVAFFGGTDPTITIPIGGVFTIGDAADGDGWPIGDTTNTLRLTNDGSTALTADVTMIGTTEE